MVVSTGYNEQINDEKSKAWGIDRLISKPMMKIELAGILRELLDNDTDSNVC